MSNVSQTGSLSDAEIEVEKCGLEIDAAIVRHRLECDAKAPTHVRLRVVLSYLHTLREREVLRARNEVAGALEHDAALAEARMRPQFQVVGYELTAPEERSKGVPNRLTLGVLGAVVVLVMAARMAPQYAPVLNSAVHFACCVLFGGAVAEAYYRRSGNG